ncbi:MAG: S46 family peptidase [Planctomycetota bacterium]
MLPRSLLPFLAALFLLPDEGQWLPTQVRGMDWKKLRERGMELDKDEFWHPEKGGVLSATVQINGCSASFVSPNGLLVTDHRCGFGAVNALSTPEHNWLRDGYAAQNAEDELPAPGMVASVLLRVEDVTERVQKAQEESSSDLERYHRTQQVIAEIEREAEAAVPGTTCTVASYLEGQEYHLHYRTRLTDIRLVYAPPRAIGEYGGEVDNWEWPRHTGDFTFFRAYCAPDGSPRAYSKDNVPYRPQHYLRVSQRGAREGGLAIVMGYPGHTERYRTSRAVAVRQTYVYPKRDEWLTAILEVLERASRRGEAQELRHASRIESLANVQKNAKGMVFGLARNAVVERKLREEEAFRKWVAADPERMAKWGTVLDDLLAIDDDEAAFMPRDLAVGFALSVAMGDAPWLGAQIQACQTALSSPNGRIPPPLLRKLASSAIDRDFDDVQRPILAIGLAACRDVPADQRLRGTEVLGRGEPDEMARALLSATKTRDPAERERIYGQGIEALENSEDPMVALALGLARERIAYQDRLRERQGRMLVVGRKWIAAQEAFRGKDFYPDANGTLRVSIATVKGYVPKDGVFHTPHTTVAGILAKNTGKEPFAAPAALVEAAAKRKDSRYFDPSIGDVPVCFLCDGDTTGGNSGSPVVDGKGELIGLNFDRVFEAVAGDFGWNPERSRNVCVDVRYVQWIIESVMPCPRLLEELRNTDRSR